MKATIKEGTLHKYEREETKLRLLGGSWSINIGEYDLTEVDTIIYETTKTIYKIDKNKAKEKGFIRTFKGEPKLIVPISSWEIILK